MKTMLLTAVGVMLFISACKKDEDVSACAQLEGTWTCTSWMEDDEQFLGDSVFILSSVIEFKAYVDSVGQGDLEWNLAYTIGGPETIIGFYSLNDNCDEVTITPKSGAPTTYQFNISGEELTLETNTNNVDVLMSYSRQR